MDNTSIVKYLLMKKIVSLVNIISAARCLIELFDKISTFFSPYFIIIWNEIMNYIIHYNSHI
jgi:hypothetical protein